jgi:hypothetical protein
MHFTFLNDGVLSSVLIALFFLIVDFHFYIYKLYSFHCFYLLANQEFPGLNNVYMAEHRDCVKYDVPFLWLLHNQ